MNRNHVSHHQPDNNMDSGLGSDDDRRGGSKTTTKEQKQLHNQQLVSGCFIDAASLSDDQEPQEATRRLEERRQGALVFQASIPQFSMLQIDEGPLNQYPEETGTPFNSIVHTQDDVGRNNVGFYVDLSQVADDCLPSATPPQTKKNIFSMVIDFEGPKKDKPTKLSSHFLRKQPSKTIGKGSSLSSSLSSVNSCVASTSRQNENHPLSQSVACLSASLVKNLSKSSSSEENVVEKSEDEPLGEASVVEVFNNDSEDVANDSEVVENDEVKTKEAQQQTSCPQYVKLSDLSECPLAAATRADLVCFGAPRMSRSIPESHWAETAFLMSRSACYRSAPHPIEPEPATGGSSDTESSAILMTNYSSHPKKSVRRLGTDLLRMFLEEIGPDVVVEVEGHKLKAHKCILASRCQYFAALLSGNWLEKNGNVISLQGFSYESVYFSLCHIYSGAAHVPDSISLVELASLADMLGLEGLKEVVEHALKLRHCHNFHKPCAGCCTGVLEVLPLSAAYGLDDLYQNCLEWLTEHFVRIWPSRAFATLPRELREKCYRQHCVHLCPDKVLDTMAACDKVLATLPAMRWAEPVSQLTLQLADACHLYHRQHFAAVLASASFHSLDAHLGFGVCDVEDRMLSAAKNLGVDQACRAYSRCCKMLDAHWSRPFADLLNKIKIQLEQCLVNQADRLIRSNAWLRLDTVLRSRIKELTPTAAEPQSRLPRAAPKKLTKPNQNSRSGQLIISSSEDSSRNSSPGTKHQLPGGGGGSPSLRRSLLLAAKSPQVPPPKVPASPGANRKSTLTRPTAASQARSVAPLLAKSRNAAVNVRPSSGGSLRSSSSTSSVARPNSSSQRSTNVVNSKRSSTVVSRNPSLGKKDTPSTLTTRRPDSRSNSPLKQLNSPRKLDTAAKSPIKVANHSIRSPSPLKKPIGQSPKRPEVKVQSSKKLKEVPPVPQPAMQRSSTFLKEEPTVLGKVI